MSDRHEIPIRRGTAGFTVEQRDRAVVVAVEGDLDLASAPQLKETLANLFRSGFGRLVLDFSGVAFMDSTGLSVLIGAQRRLAGDERFVLARPRPEVLRVFEVSRVAASFRIFSTVDSALEYVEGGGDGTPPRVLPLTTDASLMLGIASTAMPFAESDEDQVERWLRVLRRHGEAGVVLASLGLSDAPLRQIASKAEHHPAREPDPIAAVTDDAGRIATQRHATRVATVDVLLAVMRAYGATFDRVLAAHGAEIDELAARLAEAHPAVA